MNERKNQFMREMLAMIPALRRDGMETLSS